MQTPSKISILSLLLNSDVHIEALMMVLDQAFVDHDVTIDQFRGILPNRRVVQCACRHRLIFERDAQNHSQPAFLPGDSS
jgi:hypothetical protein